MPAVRRKNAQMQGYGAPHRKARLAFLPLVAAGVVSCSRCGFPIHADEPWDLGHDDYDRTLYTGPEHQSCNRGAPNRLRVSRSW